MKFEKTLLAAALAAIASTPALAIDAGWYIGANVGEAKANIDDAKIAASLIGAGFTSASVSDDDHDFGFKLLGGYQFNPYFAIEGGGFDLGKFSFDATTSPPGKLHGQMTFKGVMLDPVLMFPMTERLSAFGRVGLTYAQTESTFSASGSASAPSDQESTNLKVKFGVGLEYDVNRSLGLRLEAERYRVDDSIGNEGDVDFLSAGAVFRFGRGEHHAAPMARHVEREPERAATVPPTVVAPPPATARYCSVLDIAFEIKKTSIQREEKERLAVLGTFLQKYPDTTAVIEGHTDSVGSDELNLKLSQQRADSVVAYLVDEMHIAPSRLKAVGFGEAWPIASNATMEGKQANRRINAVISCARDLAGLVVVPARVTLGMEIEFDQQGAQGFRIEPQYFDELAEVAQFMKSHPTVMATVEGHANKNVGVGAKEVQLTPKAAMQISQRRAQAVVDYLVDKLGVARSRLTAEGFGQTRRVAYGATLAEQKENRRVNIIFNYPKKKDSAPSPTRTPTRTKR